MDAMGLLDKANTRGQSLGKLNAFYPTLFTVEVEWMKMNHGEPVPGVTNTTQTWTWQIMELVLRELFTHGTSNHSTSIVKIQPSQHQPLQGVKYSDLINTSPLSLAVREEFHLETDFQAELVL